MLENVKSKKRGKRRFNRILTKGTPKIEATQPITPVGMINTNLSPDDSTQDLVQQYASLRPHNLTAFDKRDSSKGSIDSRKLSIQMINEEFKQDRRNSRHHKYFRSQIKQFMKAQEGKLTPLITVPKEKRLTVNSSKGMSHVKLRFSVDCLDQAKITSL